jgi:hypothetical protein
VTRAERLAEQVRKAKNKLAAEAQRAKAALAVQRMAVAQAEAVVREERRKATNKTRYYVGALADNAGLLAWSVEDIKAVFAALKPLLEVPNPGRMLEGLFLEEAELPVLGLGISPEIPLSRQSPIPSDSARDHGDTSDFRPWRLPTNLTNGK